MQQRSNLARDRFAFLTHPDGIAGRQWYLALVGDQRHSVGRCHGMASNGRLENDGMHPAERQPSLPPSPQSRSVPPDERKMRVEFETDPFMNGKETEKKEDGADQWARILQVERSMGGVPYGEPCTTRRSDEETTIDPLGR